MADTRSDFIWSRLHERGVRRINGYSGDGIGGLIAGLQRREGDIEFVQVMHEEGEPDGVGDPWSRPSNSSCCEPALLAENFPQQKLKAASE